MGQGCQVGMAFKFSLQKVKFNRSTFVTGTNQDQITPNRRGVYIGQRRQLSALDVQGIKEYYACGKADG